MIWKVKLKNIKNKYLVCSHLVFVLPLEFKILNLLFYPSSLKSLTGYILQQLSHLILNGIKS